MRARRKLEVRMPRRVAVLVAAAVEAVRERSDRPVPSENLVGLCEFHHLRCIHGGWLRVTGRAPDALTWTLRGRIWTGPHT